MDVVNLVHVYPNPVKEQENWKSTGKLFEGKPPARWRSKDEVLGSHFSFADEMSKVPADRRSDTIIVPPAYALSVAALESLRPMRIKDMKLERHHRGRYLLLQSRGPTVRGPTKAIVACMLDEHDDAIILNLHDYPEEQDRKASDVIDSGACIIVKEPYLRLAKDSAKELVYVLRVDHLSDVIFLDDDDDRIPAAWQKAAPVETALALKGEGDDFLEKDKNWQAIKAYTRALALTEDLSEAAMIKRSRSQVYLRTKQYDATLADTDYPNIDSATPFAVLVRASEALYQFGRYVECTTVRNFMAAKYSSHPGLQERIDNAQRREMERSTGEYDFAQMQCAAAIIQPPHLDYATYIDPIGRRDTEMRGRGMFLTADVEAGDLLLCEKAFCYADGDMGMSELELVVHANEVLLDESRVVAGGHRLLRKSCAQKVHLNPSLALQFNDLYHGHYLSVGARDGGGNPVTDSFLVNTIVGLNEFGCPRSSITAQKQLSKYKDVDRRPYRSCGVWLQAFYFNHSCMGNAHRSFIGDMMIVRAAQDLKAGTELLMPYHDPARYYGTEMKNALKHWGFACTCAICKDFETTDANTLEEKDAQFKELTKLCGMSPWSQGQHDQFEAALQKCEATYTHSETEVPRIRLADLQALFAVACAANEMLEKSLEWVVKAMQSLGFIFEGADASDVPFSIVRWGYPTVTLVKKMLLHLKSVFGHLDLEEKAEQVEPYARMTYRILLGEEDTFDKTLERETLVVVIEERQLHHDSHG